MTTELFFPGVVGVPEGLIGVSNRRLELVSHVGAVLLEQQDVPFQRFLQVHHGRQWVVGHIHAIQGVFGQITAFGHHHRHRIADVANLVFGQGVLKEPFQFMIGAHPYGDGPRFHRLLDIPIGQHANHAFHGQRGAGIDGQDSGVSVGAAHDGRVEHVGQFHVIDELPLTG